MNWISVKDNVPEKWKRVLVYDRWMENPTTSVQTKVLIGFLRKGIDEQTYSWGTDDVCCDKEILEVTHWMELPKEPILEN